MKLDNEYSQLAKKKKRQLTFESLLGLHRDRYTTYSRPRPISPITQSILWKRMGGGNI